MKRFALLLLALVVVAVGVVAWLNFRDEGYDGDTTRTASKESITRGEYLARIGNCEACHTRRGGAAFAGGRGIPTPFGTVYATNLTPDSATGLGRWTAAEFWRALHNGRSRSGRLLYPAFPYPHYTEMRREDSDALFDYLRSLPAVAEPNVQHALRFPYNTQAALAVWRALYFRPGAYVDAAERPPEWNRGAYLVRGLGHCGACHASRDPLGGLTDSDALGGGLIPMQGWYAPSLASRSEAGVQDWDVAQVVALLKVGTSSRGSVLGPMAEVVYRSTQYLSDGDARAIATFLKSLPDLPLPPAAPVAAPDALVIEHGRAIYVERCRDCHGDAGEGRANVYPALAGNRAVVLASPANSIRAVLNGGFPPGTAGNPRPFGMPPFAPFLSDGDVAAVVTYIRNAWGNRASSVADWQVGRFARGAARE
jgi:mono/diheme cytochrome c family protein